MSGRAKVGGGGLLIIVLGAVFALLSGADPMQVLQRAGQQVAQQQRQAVQGGGVGGGGQVDEAVIAAQQDSAEFVGVVLKDTEDVWNSLFPKLVGEAYRPPTLVLFSGYVDSACGSASSASGPFYCPGDFKVYLDLTFFDELRTKFKAPGDFACAYVVAHEVGHHIQNLLGLSAEVQQRRQRLSTSEGNQLSVRLELQADYLAGVWAHHAQRTKQIMEDGDLEEAIRAAQQIGDDTLQRQATGRVVPDAFTHGTAKQRTYWFTRGFKTGDFSEIGKLFELSYNQL